MKPLVIALALVAGLVSLSHSQNITLSSQDDRPAPPADVQRISQAPTRWEYKVVGMVDRHGSTLSYLKRAIEGERNPLEIAKGVDEQVAQKTEDLLNELGAEGWELQHFAEWALILKRPMP